MSKRRPGSKHYDRMNRRRWERTRRAVLERDGWRCTECGGAGKLEVHHIKKLESGGDPYDPDNCLTFCRSCHIDLHRFERMTPGRAAWLEFVGELMP